MPKKQKLASNKSKKGEKEETVEISSPKEDDGEKKSSASNNEDSTEGSNLSPTKHTNSKPNSFTHHGQGLKNIIFPCPDKEIYAHETLKELKIFAKGLQSKGQLSSRGAQLMVLKWQRRTHRRAERREERRWVNKECFNCRQVGHLASDCKALEESSEFSMGVCFKCGSTEHKIQQCKVKVKGFPFAQCFVCGENGHLSRDCSDNPNGIFPKGGNCKECGSKEHLVRDCPDLKCSPNYEEVVLNRWNPGAHASVEEEDNVLLSTSSPPRKKKSKIVQMV